MEQKVGPQLADSNKKYVLAQKFCNFLMSSSETHDSLKQQIQGKEELQFYLLPERMEAFIPMTSSVDD